MQCQACFELMSLKLDHQLTAEQASKLDQLMQDCPDCQRLWAALGESEQLLQAERTVQVGPPDPDAFTAAVMRKVAAQNYVLGAHPERHPRILEAASWRARMPKFPWSPGAVHPQALTWASTALATCLAVAAVTWMWLTSTLNTRAGNNAPPTRLALLQRAITDVGQTLNWQLLAGALLLAVVMIGVWLILVNLARRQLGDWEAAE